MSKIKYSMITNKHNNFICCKVKSGLLTRNPFLCYAVRVQVLLKFICFSDFFKFNLAQFPRKTFYIRPADYFYIRFISLIFCLKAVKFHCHVWNCLSGPLSRVKAHPSVEFHRMLSRKAYRIAISIIQFDMTSMQILCSDIGSTMPPAA